MYISYKYISYKKLHLLAHFREILTFHEEKGGYMPKIALFV